MAERRSLCLSGVTKVYGSGSRAVTACRNVGLRAGSGEVTGLLGPNGAGKTTVLSILCGILLPTEGEAVVCGTDNAAAIRRMTGFVSETPMLDPRLTVRETLFSECLIHGLSRDQAARNVEWTAKELGLLDVMQKKVSVLSKGYAQRTSLARAICFDPAVLVMDEFSGGLDPSQIASIRKTIRKLSESKIVVLSTHHIDEALSLCTRLYVMNAGTVCAEGTPSQIQCLTGTASLEQAFLALTGGEG